jgi:UDP-N-acetyl-2-amino-2-deoxyglucuronate dehydrogenase
MHVTRPPITGCGRIANNHFDSVNAHAEHCELTDVCDVDPTALAAAVAKTGARGHTSLTSLLAHSSADCVVLTTPSGLHPAQAAEAARAGFDVMTEKPMATRWPDGLAMVRACDEAGVRLFVVKQNRRNRTLQLLKQAVQQGRFGRIYMVGVNVFWTRPQAYYDSAAWRGTWEFDGGAFMNQASHYVDLLDWVVGPVESVMAYTGTLARDIEGSITILGEKGSVRVGGVAVNEIKHWEFETPDPMDVQIADASYQTTSVYGFGHPLYYRNVIDTLRGEAHPEIDGREGLKSLELLIAMYMSARDGKRISLPLAY